VTRLVRSSNDPQVLAGRSVAVVISGGNVDQPTLRRVLTNEIG